MSATDTLEDVQLELDIEGPDHAHYASKHNLVEAMIEGTPIVALCGYVFVPYRNPERFPICPKCAEIHKMLPE